jgi:Starch-binding associating with outer membrane/Susd and RagB outer membrane lipoprotein
MKYLKNISKSVLATVTILLVGSCSLNELDINKDPNNPLEAAQDLVLTRIQVDIASNFAGIEGDLETYVGLIGTQGLSRFELTNASYNGTWGNIYTEIAKDIDGLIQSATTNNSFRFLGVAKILKAYTYGTMVDLFGDVPYKESASGEKKILNPVFDSQAEIYANILTLLDEAVVDLDKTTAIVLSGDLMCGNSLAKWKRVANSLKLKFLMTGRLAIPNANTEIKKLLDAPASLIAGASDDFQFQFSKDPTSIRHPWYTGAYTGGEFDYTYINHQIIVEMVSDKDPRRPFYFRRQTKRFLNVNDPTDRGTLSPGYLPTNANALTSMFPNGLTRADSLFVNGLFGRERGDQTGIPSDGALRLLPGVYPCGGFHDHPYDVSAITLAPPSANAAPGGGIFPMLTDININYYRVEAALKGIWGTEADARAALSKAITDHIGRVVTFGVATDPTSVRPTQAAIDAYRDLWLARWDATTNAEQKLDLAMKSLWFASFGNGFEIYNANRRLGYPSKLTDPGAILPLSRKSVLRLPYPQNELNLNSNAAKYKDVIYDREPIFWDK